MEPSLLAQPLNSRRERRLFLFIVIFLLPILTVATVCGYGFAVWLFQLLMGPPGSN